MSSLINTKIEDTYEGLIKTADNLPIDANLKNLEDGNGGVLPIQVSTTGVNFTGTVTGIPSEAGLINGVGANSLISSPDLTTTPASAPLGGQIAIGNGATTGNLVANAVAIGNNAVGGGGTAVGNGAQAFNAGRSAAYGANARSLGNESLAVGGDAFVPSSSTRGVAIGDNAQVTANTIGAVALGAQVTADKANTVSIKALDLQTASTPSAGGIIMTDAGSTERRLNITAAGALQIDSTPVGGGGGGIENYFGTKAYVNPQGFPASAYYFLTYPTDGGGAQPATDQNDNTAILSRFFPNAGIPITEWVIPIFANGFTGNYDLEVAVYDVIPGTNEPGGQLFSTPLTIALTGSDVYHNHVFVTPFTPPTSNLYIAIQSTNSGTNNVKVGMMQANKSLNSGLVTNFGSIPGGDQRGINSLYLNSGNLPAAFTAGQVYGHRDEFLILGYR